MKTKLNMEELEFDIVCPVCGCIETIQFSDLIDELMEFECLYCPECARQMNVTEAWYGKEI